jgi:hypothetical protein
MKNRILISLISAVVMLAACKKNEPEPVITNSNGPEVTIEKITNTNQLVEGTNDTVFFKVKLNKPYRSTLGNYPQMKVLISYGDTMGVSGVDLFVYDQTGSIDPTYDYFQVGRNDPNKPRYTYYAVNFYEGETEHIVGLKPKENFVYEIDKVYDFLITQAIYPDFGGYYVDRYSLKLSYDYIDNDPIPVVGFDHGISTTSQIQETNGMNQSLRIKMTNRSGFVTPITYSISGTATAGVDYIIQAPSPVKITQEFIYYDLKFDVLSDAVVEGTESFTIKLISAEKALIGSPINNTIFLRDSIQVYINE